MAMMLMKMMVLVKMFATMAMMLTMMMTMICLKISQSGSCCLQICGVARNGGSLHIKASRYSCPPSPPHICHLICRHIFICVQFCCIPVNISIICRYYLNFLHYHSCCHILEENILTWYTMNMNF